MNLKRLLPVIGLIVLLVILFTIDFKEIFRIFTSLNPLYAFLSFFIVVPLLILVNIEWQLLLKSQKIKVSFWYSMKNFFIGYFYGFITPGGWGAYARALYLEDESGAPLPKCFSNIIIFNTVELISMLIPGAIGALILSSVYPNLFGVILLIFLVVIILYLFFFKSDRSIFVFKKIVKSRIFEGLKDRLEDSIDTFHEDLPSFINVLLPFCLSITGWFLKYLLLFFVAKMFLIEIPFVYFIAIMAVVDVIAAIPISSYGLGIRDGALIYLLTRFNFTDGKIIPVTIGSALISAEQVLSFSLFWFVIMWLTPSLFGAFITIRETRKLYGGFKLDKQTTTQFEIYMRKFPELYRHLALIVKKNTAKKSDSIIVDLGVGPGLLSKEINQLMPKAHIIGVDPLDEMLKLANKNASLEVKKGSAESIPMDDESVDVVVSRFNLTYWKNPRKGFFEINRVLKPGGKFVIEALNRDFSRFNLFLIRISMVFKGSGWDIAKYHIDAYKTAYKFETVEKLFKDAGFKITYNEGKKTDWKFIIVGKK